LCQEFLDSNFDNEFEHYIIRKLREKYAVGK